MDLSGEKRARSATLPDLQIYQARLFYSKFECSILFFNCKLKLFAGLERLRFAPALCANQSFSYPCPSVFICGQFFFYLPIFPHFSTINAYAQTLYAQTRT